MYALKAATSQFSEIEKLQIKKPVYNCGIKINKLQQTFYNRKTHEQSSSN